MRRIDSEKVLEGDKVKGGEEGGSAKVGVITVIHQVWGSCSYGKLQKES